MTAEQKHCQS